MKSNTLIATVLISTTLIGCGMKQEPRTKWTDPAMRVMIDPESIDEKNYVKIMYALQQTGRWIVVDRADGFRAIKKEQEMLHRSEPERFADREKYAHWGKLYGVGGIVIAQTTCQRMRTFAKTPYLKCSQNLAIVDANSGEVLAVAEEMAESDLGWDSVPSWSKTAWTLTDNFPKHFYANRNHERLERYKDLSRENAVRTKEENARQRIEDEKDFEKYPNLTLE